jgi:hypothetical protein
MQVYIRDYQNAYDHAVMVARAFPKTRMYVYACGRGVDIVAPWTSRGFLVTDTYHETKTAEIVDIMECSPRV